MSGGYALQPAELDAVAARLKIVSTDLESEVGSLAAGPDAGRSSDEVGRSLKLLAAGLRALSAQVSGVSAALTTSADGYRSVDEQVGQGFEATGTTP